LEELSHREGSRGTSTLALRGTAVSLIGAAPKFIAGRALCPTRIDWTTLLKWTYDFDALSCPCGGRLKSFDLLIEVERAKELLEQFGMSTKPTPVARALVGGRQSTGLRAGELRFGIDHKIRKLDSE
jgi:hypothetical protein